MAEETKRERKLQASRFNLAEHKRNIFHVVPEDGVTLEDVLEPSFWAHISNRLRPTDRIEVYAEDGSYFAELIVREAGHLFAKVQVLRKVDLEGETSGAVASVSGHDVAWKGPHHKWAVVRGKDVIQGGFDTKEGGFAWLASNSKSLAA